MLVEIDYKQIVGEIKERNRFFKALQEIRKLADNIDENNFEVQSKLIVETCKDALIKRPNKISKKTKQLLEEYDYEAEYILSGEFMEQFQV
jgi:membrane-associated HD superfamily phosphohydrolase